MHQLLRTLPDVLKTEVWKRAKVISLKKSEVLIEQGAPIDHVYFMESGVLALLADASDQTVGAGLIGRNGVAGVEATQGAQPSFCDIRVLLPGEAVRIPVESASLLLKHHASSEAIWKQQYDLLVQAQLTLACFSSHELRQRLASLLLQLQRLSGRDQFDLTQDDIAALLANQRTSISLEAARMKAQGTINYSRGKIRINDPSRLRHFACGCFQRISEATSISI